MDAVLGILGTVGAVAGPIFGLIGKVFSNIGDILSKFSLGIFLAGFFGILLAFLWFFFRYLDEKKLKLPAVMFTLFFIVFLSGNILLIKQDAKAKEEAKRLSVSESAETTEATEAAAGGDAGATLAGESAV